MSVKLNQMARTMLSWNAMQRLPSKDLYVGPKPIIYQRDRKEPKHHRHPDGASTKPKVSDVYTL
jgi:hypothetical protein